MKRIIPLSMICATSIMAQEFTFKPKGELQFRFHNKQNQYSDLGKFVHNQKKTSYSDYIVAGLLGIESSYKTYKLNTLAYGVGRLKDKDGNILKNERTFYNNELNSFLFLGELNLEKKLDSHQFKIGRQSYDSSLVGKNHRITQNSYEGIKYGFKKNNFSLEGFYFNKIAASTLSGAVPFNHKYGFLGYGLGYKIGEFNHISNHIINKKLPTNGALHIEVKYGKKDNYISYENLFVDNFFNTSNLSAAYNILDNLNIKAGAIYQTSIGDKHIEKNIELSQQGKKLESKLYQGEIKYQKNNIALIYTATYTPYSSSSIYNGTLYSPFSNGSSFILSMNTIHSTIADTFSQQIQISTLQKIKGLPVHFIGSIIKYDIGDNNGLSSTALDTKEWFLHAKGYFSKNLSAKVQYSNVKNQDPLTSKLHNTRFVVEYKF